MKQQKLLGQDHMEAPLPVRLAELGQSQTPGIDPQSRLHHSVHLLDDRLARIAYPGR